MCAIIIICIVRVCHSPHSTHSDATLFSESINSFCRLVAGAAIHTAATLRALCVVTHTVCLCAGSMGHTVDLALWWWRFWRQGSHTVHSLRAFLSSVHCHFLYTFAQQLLHFNRCMQ